MVKLNISNPATGAVKSVEVEDERKLRIFYDKRISQEVSVDSLGDEFKGYIFKITGGNDKQGFPMMQGVLVQGRKRLLLGAEHPCYRPRREGERRRKSVRGCIVGPDMSAINLVIVKKGDGELPDLTDKYVPRRLGPKRASKIRKLFALAKEDDVRKFVIRRALPDRVRKNDKGEKTFKRTKAPKIQRLITPRRLQHKKREFALKNKRITKAAEEAAEYAKLMEQRKAVFKQRRASEVAKRRSQRASQRGETAEDPKKTKTAAPAKPEKAVAKKGAAKTSAKPAAEAKPAAKPAAPKAEAKPAAAAKPAAEAKKAAAPAKPAAAAKKAAKK